VFPSRERRTRTRGPTAGSVRVEIDRNSWISKTDISIGAPLEIAICLGQTGELYRVATQQHRLGD
jgi:hypothetical protein